MEKTRTLPPLVRGRVTGVLDFFVDKIKIKNTAQLLDTYDLVLQVQWWGEDSPIYIRPKKACCQPGQAHTFFDLVEMHFQCARYEIKTTLGLFESYLKTCEVLELCVLDAVQNCIIGSAFIRDLVNFLNNSNNLVTVPVFDYTGEEIGDITVSLSFLDMSQQNNVRKQAETIYKNRNTCNGKLCMRMTKFNIRNEKKDSYFTTPEQSILQDVNEKINYEDLPSDVELSIKKYAPQENKKIINQAHNSEMSFVPRNKRKMNSTDKKVVENPTCFCKCLPEIINSSDSSKVLYFGVNQQKCKRYSLNENLKIGVTNKFNSNSIKCKSKVKNMEALGNFLSDQSLPDGRKLKKKPPANKEIYKNCQKKSSKVVDLKKCEMSSEDDSSKAKELPDCTQTIGDVTSEDSINSKVLDFLLGSDLSKEDEQSAVNEFKKMSFSHNLVDSINQLCLTSDNENHKPGNGYPVNSLTPTSQWTGLTFNFKDPIERNYYETFFLNVNSSPELELAEILNQPENSVALEKLKTEKNVCNKGSSQSGRFKGGKFLGEKNVEVPKVEHPARYNNSSDGAKGCAQCKYYKKLDELDAIIESLKHFEKKMLMHDRDLEFVSENSKMYVKKCQPKNS